MARPRKPASQKLGKSESKEHLDKRAKIEEELKGNVDKFMDIPEHLDDLAKEYYLFLINELEIMNLLSNLDIPILEQTADSLSKMRQADSLINAEGMIVWVTDRYGNRVQKEHVAVNTKQKYLNQFKALSTQLGLSPSSRATLSEMKLTKEESDSDPIKKILGMV